MAEWLRERSAPLRRAGARRTSLRRRITWLVAAAVALAAALVALAAYVVVRDQLADRVDEELLGRARLAATSDLASPQQIVGVARALTLTSDASVRLVAADGSAYPAGSRLPPVGDPELAVAAGRLEESLRTVDGQRVAAVPVRATLQPLALVVSQPTAPTERTLRRLGLVLLAVGLLGVAGAALAGRAVARSALRPVQQLTDAAETVARTEELEPIEVTGDDELARLAVAFNAMLAALDQARTRQRRLVADAGHELRTPLTSLRTNLDLLAQSDAAPAGARLDPGVRAELLDDVRAQVAELGGLVGDLVELSRDDRQRPRAEQLDLAALVGRAVERARRRGPGLAWDVRLEPWTVVGDPAALERAVTNLLDNAAKWGPAGSTVSVALRRGTLVVSDQGPGIAPEDLPHVFERFYRSAAARAMPGSGLGLAIVAQTAQRHGGSVTAGAAPGGGARFTLTLPAAPAAPAAHSGSTAMSQGPLRRF
ncbi:sensor histidine kinase [Vallicoccus soli]|uniref:histidine kinase n=2 Tax=Vallicoccus soli TaxID=2339232 RepID=A0A3A3ZBI0_9ACTN|nr:sensor histidine kinase [Vallicoccus soli]